MRESFISSLKSAIIWKTLNKFCGLLKHVVIAAAIGLSAQLDIFYMAMALCGVFVFTWAQMLEVMAVPKLVALNKNDNKKEFLSITGGLFVLTFIFSILLTIILLSGRKWFAMVAWGFDQDKKTFLANAFVWFSPVFLLYIPLYFIGSVFRSVRKFKLFYQFEFIIGISSLILIFIFRHHPQVLFWSFSAGLIVAFIFLFFRFVKEYNPWANPFSKEVMEVLKIAPGLLILQGAQYIYLLTDHVFISFLGNGSIGALVYGRTIAFFVENLIGIKNSFITIFSEADNNTKKINIYNDLISLSVYISLPLTVFFLFFGSDLIAICLERGMFKQSDTRLVNIALSGFCWSLLPMILQVPLEQVFQVYGKLELMVSRKLYGLIINAALNALFLFIFKWGIWGIALATSLSYWFILIYSIYAASKLKLVFAFYRHIKWSMWNLIASLSSVYLVIEFGKSIDWKYTILCQCVLYGLIILLLGICYRGFEGKLVKNAVMRIVLTNE